MKEIKMRIVLASKSPRRKELLGSLFKNFEIITKPTDESLPKGIHPKECVNILAIRKGAAVASELSGECVVISSDTLVELDGLALGKPTDEADAMKILRSLSGRVHNVHTGIAVHYLGKCVSGVATTSVSFKELTDREIADYIKTGEPMDKAGAYGIQGEGGKFVNGYNGDFDTVVGLSVSLTGRLVEDITGIRIENL